MTAPPWEKRRRVSLALTSAEIELLDDLLDVTSAAHRGHVVGALLRGLRFARQVDLIQTVAARDAAARAGWDGGIVPEPT